MLEFIKYLALAATMLPEIVKAVKYVEATVKAVKGGELKKELVMQTIGAVLEALDDVVKLDRDRVVKLAGFLVDAVVGVFNAYGEFKHEA